MMKTVKEKIAYVILIILWFSVELIQTTTKTTSWKDTLFGNFGRDSRFLSLFTIVQIGPGFCSIPSGELGQCLPSKECAIRGGRPAGQCAAGYGLCCIFIQTCNGIIRENGTYFVNPNHPDSYDTTGSCQVTIMKLHPGICQIRLDLDIFSIAPPEPINNVCNQDQLLISGGSPAPIVCGTSTGDHMYIDAGLGQSNPIIISVITSGPSFDRMWRIRVSQIHCGSIYSAPTGCLQYHTGISGTVRSFNFDTVSGRQLSNQDYSICIRTEKNFCSIQYSATPDSENDRSRSFTLSGNSNNVVMAMVGSGSQGQPNSCPNDWLLIGCARVADRVPISTSCEDRICGGTFNAEVSSTPRTVSTSIRPFRLSFHTDAVEMPNDVDNRGFSLDYVQQPCTNG